jgi:hypothetical protein
MWNLASHELKLMHQLRTHQQLHGLFAYDLLQMNASLRSVAEHLVA